MIKFLFLSLIISYSSYAHSNSCKGLSKINCYNLASLEEKKGNTSLASELYKQTCEGGNGSACVNYAFLIERDQPQYAKAIYQMYCDRNNTSACYMMGIKNLESYKEEKSLAYFKKSCRHGLKLGCEVHASVLTGKYYLLPKRI
jgi:TPR repeat protein